MAASPLISVIVPIYNVEPYLDACVSSIAEQSYTNLEIILVDDGSPDRCPEMCDRWAEKDPRVRVIHKSNGGLSDARNCGMQQASGDYFSFVDGDDTIAPDFILSLYDALIASGSQIAMCAIRICSNGEEIISETALVKKAYCSAEECLSALIRDEIRQIVCNKLYDRTLLEGLFFPVGKRHEDEFWSFRVFGRCDRAVKTDYAGYNYWKRSGSIMDEPFSLTRLDQLEAKCQRQEYLAEHFPSLIRQGQKDVLFFTMYLGQHTLSEMNKQDRSQALHILKNTCRQYPPSFSLLKGCKFTHKIWLILEQLSFTGTCRLRNFLKIGL